MPRRGENIRRRKDGRWEGRYIKGYDSKKKKAKYASVYGKTYAETKLKLNEAKYKNSVGIVYVDAKNKLFGEIISSWFNAQKINLNYAFVTVNDFGTSKLLGNEGSHEFLMDTLKHGSGSEKVGALVGAGIRRMIKGGRNSQKLEEEQNWYSMVSDIFDEIIA